MMRKSFRYTVESKTDELQNALIRLQNNSAAKDVFADKSIKQNWPLVIDSYPKAVDNVLRALLPIVSTHLYESGFSTTSSIRTKQRNRLRLEDDIKVVVCRAPHLLLKRS